jgi:hypothetical protein
MVDIVFSRYEVQKSVCITCKSGHNSELPGITLKTRVADAWGDEIADTELRLLANITHSKLAEAERLNRAIIPLGLEIRIDDGGQPNVGCAHEKPKLS